MFLLKITKPKGTNNFDDTKAIPSVIYMSKILNNNYINTTYIPFPITSFLISEPKFIDNFFEKENEKENSKNKEIPENKSSPKETPMKNSRFLLSTIFE